MIRRTLVAGASVLAILLAEPSDGQPIMWGFIGGFPPTNHVYTATGSHTETIPPGAQNMTIEDCGAGGSGSSGDGSNHGRGGGSGAYVKKAFTLASTDWNKTLTAVVGIGGAAPGGQGVNGHAGTASTVVNATYGTTVNFSAGGGGGGTGTVLSGTNGAGGVASGGTTNTAGNAGSGANGGAAVAGTQCSSAAGTTGPITGAGTAAGNGTVVFEYT